MKKITALLLLMMSLILVGCQSKPETLGITEVNQSTAKLEDVIDPNLKLQIAFDGDNRYIVLHTAGDVSVTATVEDNVALVNFEMDDNRGGQKNQYIYILTLDPEQDTIDVSINGERTHFESSIIF